MGMVERRPELRDAALLARRSSMWHRAELVNELAGLASWEEAVIAVLDAPPREGQAPVTDDAGDAITWWTEQILAPDSGLHERLTFFWHTLLTSHRWGSGDQENIARQLNMLRANALGNFRTLLQSFVVDGALIHYLNANSSTAKKPNENLARELMELFSVGIGHYSEDDVRAAALAITGWRTRDDGTVALEPDRAHNGPLTFLGENKNWDIVSIVDRLCDHPATAARISSLLWYHLVGSELPGDRATELGSWWQGQNLEIKPLLGRIFNEPDFRANHYSRPRSGFEVYAVIAPICGFEPGKHWRSRHLGQALYEPPNVAGWPSGERWLTPDSLLRRSDMMFSFDLAKMPGGVARDVDEILDRCGLYVVSDATLAAIDNAGNTGLDEGSVAQLRWRIALSSPELQLT